MGLLNSLMPVFCSAQPQRPMSGSEPGGEGGPSTEIARIEQTMRERPAEYFRDEGMQGRYTDLLTARERHTAAPARTSTAAAREISAIETTMRTNAAAYWKSPEMQERYVALIALRDGSAAPAGKTVIGTQRTPQSPQAMLAEHDRLAELALVTPKPVIKSTPKAAPSPPAKVRPVDAYTAMLARNDALRAAQSPVADGDTGVSGHQFSPFLQRATEAEARVRMPAALVEEWSKGDFTYSLWHTQRMMELIADTMGDSQAVAAMGTRFRELPEGARVAVLRMLASPYPTTVNVATAGELEAFKKLPGGAAMLTRFGKDAAPGRVGMFLDRFKASEAATPPQDAPAVRVWWDEMPHLEKCSIIYILACGG
jgi:hypothetical protein